MLYSTAFTIPANTPTSAPVRGEFRPINSGLGRVSIIFPDGACGLVGIRMYTARGQFIPQGGGWLAGLNKERVEWDSLIMLEGPPFYVWFEGYNTASDFAHTLQMIFDVR